MPTTLQPYTVEQYRSRPPREDGPCPPRSLGTWPTGFSGHGWLVRDARGRVVYAHAFRADALAWVRRHS